jgi:hypothetical protein
VGLPSTPTVIAVSRVQRTWVSDGAKQNAHVAVAGNGFAAPKIESYICGFDLGFIPRFQPHACLADCDRAPPRSSFTTFS